MPRFTPSDILKMDDPYQILIEDGEPAEHIGALNTLGAEAMISVASRMAMKCPSEDLLGFNRRKEIFRSFGDSQFYDVLSPALQIKLNLERTVNAEDTESYTAFIEPEFDADLYNPFSELVQQSIQDKDTLISTNLALCTPTDRVSELLKNLDLLGETIGTTSRAAFNLHQNLLNLLGDAPETFFSNQEFDINLCNQFPLLISRMVHGKENAIGEKLAQLPMALRSDVASKLEKLNPKSVGDHNPFKSIAKALEQAARPASSRPNTQSLFAPPANDLRRRPTTQLNSVDDDYDEDDDRPNLTCGGCSII